MKKSIALLALGKLAPKSSDSGSPDGDGPDDEGANQGLEMAMEDFLAAFKKDDAKGMAMAFENAHDLCQSGDMGPPEGPSPLGG